MFNGACRFFINPFQVCKANANFNGVACSCDAGYFEVSQGSCLQCPNGQIWNGNACSSVNICASGYTFDSKSNGCIARGISCGQNSKWNGAFCQCLAGYHLINNNCVKCPAGTGFDGQTCNPSNPSNNCGSN